MNVNSHVQLPRFILNNFRSKNGKVWNLNLNDCKLHSCGAKKLGTQKGYYSQELEQYLNQQVENPFSKLAYKIATFVEQGEESLILSADTENICKQYISVAAFRSKKAYSDFLKGSLAVGLLDDQTSHDGLAFFSTKFNSGIIPEISESRMIVLINKTDKEFVVPRNCFYLISSKGFPCIIAPITPFCAITILICFALSVMFVFSWAYQGISLSDPDYSSLGFKVWFVEQLVIIAVSILVWFCFQAEKRKKVMKEIRDDAVILEEKDLSEIRQTASVYPKKDLMLMRGMFLHFLLHVLIFRWWIILLYTVPALICAYIKADMDTLPSNHSRVSKLLSIRNDTETKEKKTETPKERHFLKGYASYVLGQLNLLFCFILGGYPGMLWLIPLLSVLGIYMGHMGRRDENDYFAAFVGLILNRITLCYFIMAVVV